MGAEYTKTSPVGIDIPIQKLQIKLYAYLSALWSTANYKSYGRVYVNDVADKSTPMVHVSGNNYHDVLPDKKYSAMSFMFVSDNVPVNGRMYAANVSLIFFGNLTSLKPTKTHRADEEVRNDILVLLEKEPYGFKLIDYVTGINATLSDFNIDGNTLLGSDLQPNNVARFDLELIYNNYKPSTC